MSKTKSFASFALLATAVVLIELFMVNSYYFQQNADILSLAITVDLTIIVPLLFYLLVIRKKYLPPTTLIAVFILTLLISHHILPSENQDYLKYIAMIAPIAEFFALLWFLSKIRKVVRKFREARAKELYFTDAFSQAVNAVLGSPLASYIIATELSLLYYAFCGWFLKFRTGDNDIRSFSIHRKNNYSALFGVFIFLLGVETIALHVVIAQFSEQWAYILTGLGIYCLLWFIGDYQAIRLQPVVLSETHLHLRAGMRWKAKVALSNIDRIEEATALPEDKMYLNISIFGKPELIIYLRYSMIITGLFGIQRRVNKIGVCVDDEALFQNEIRNR